MAERFAVDVGGVLVFGASRPVPAPWLGGRYTFN
jgi:hypothetical protein